MHPVRLRIVVRAGNLALLGNRPGWQSTAFRTRRLGWPWCAASARRTVVGTLPLRFPSGPTAFATILNSKRLSRPLQAADALSPRPAMPCIIDMRLPHDSAFKRFAHSPAFIRHTLRAHPLAGIDEAEVEAIEDAGANFVDRRLVQRVADAVWRLRMADGSITFLLVECQAKVDPSMPFRMLNAVSALYLALSLEPPPEYSAASVPRIKHLTIYSGQRPWSAVGEVGAAIAVRCAEAERDIPRMECPVLELRRWPDPGGDSNVAVLLGRLQRCDSPEALLAAAEPLKPWCGSASHASLAGAFATWISHVRVPELGVLDAVKSDKLDVMPISA